MASSEAADANSTKEQQLKNLSSQKLLLEALCKANEEHIEEKSPEELKREIEEMKNKLKSFQEKQNAKSGMVQNAADTNESTGILFPDEHPQEQEKKDLQLSLKKAMDKTANVSLEIVDKLRNLQRIRDEIREFRVKNQKIRTTHRHMVKQLEEARKSQQERSHNVEQQAEVKRAEDEVEVQARKNDVLRHVLRNLVIESGEEWVNNAGLVDLVLTLDDTAAEKLENFQSNEEEVTSMSTRSEI